MQEDVYLFVYIKGLVYLKILKTKTNDILVNVYLQVRVFVIVISIGLIGLWYDRRKWTWVMMTYEIIYYVMFRFFSQVKSFFDDSK